ncbi:MAG: TRAP transporter substrate-binding protein DctP [Gammaproteobacteria bacterium]|nr:TRAP transporter substrate-binding protein DctP [Gammaproteobacteria bacterium]
MLLLGKKSVAVLVMVVTNILVSMTPVGATVFKIATLSPDGTSWMQRMRAGAAEIEKKTNGQVTFKFFPGGIMGNDQSVLRKIRIGQLHGGALTDGGLKRIYPESQVYALPFTFRTFEEVDYVRERLDGEIVAGLEKAGFVSFGLAEGGFAYLMSGKPLKSIEDVKGQKVWIPEGDKLARTVFETGGVSPIPLPLADVMTGLQTGLIDTVVTSPIGAVALQWHTRVKYMTDLPLTYFYALLAIDKKAFQKLSREHQAVVREVMTGIYKEINKQNRMDNANATKALIKQGITMVTVSSEEKQRWEQNADKARQELRAQGLYKGGIFDKLSGLIGSYRKATAQ